MSKSLSCNHTFYRFPQDKPGSYMLEAISARLMNGGYIFERDKLVKARDLVNPVYIQEIPCGQCINCRLRYSYNWAVRCMLEASLYERNYFITLTYNDLYLPKGDFLDYDGNVKGDSLVRKHVVDFIKRFREHCRKKYNHTGIRFFYCGEYGSLFDRPHYHLIAFNCPPIDLKFFKRSGTGYDIYNSSDVELTWGKKIYGKDAVLSYGYHSVQDVTFDSCAYTARYMLKKIKGLPLKTFTPENLAEYNECYDEDLKLRSNAFCGMSNRPGLAKAYALNNLNTIYDTDEVLFKDDFELHRARPPRYFDKIFDDVYPEEFAKLKEERAARHYDNSKARASLISEHEFARLNREEEISLQKERKRKWKI